METIDTSLRQNPNYPLGKAALEYGVISALISIALMTVTHLTHMNMEGWGYKIMSWLITIGLALWIVWNFREKKNQGFLRYGQGVGLSVLSGVVAGIIVGIFFFFFVKYIAPEIPEKALDQAIADMEAKDMPESQIKQAVEMTRMFLTPGMMSVFAVLGTILTYLVLGLISSAIFKRD